MRPKGLAFAWVAGYFFLFFLGVSISINFRFLAPSIHVTLRFPHLSFLGLEGEQVNIGTLPTFFESSKSIRCFATLRIGLFGYLHLRNSKGISSLRTIGSVKARVPIYLDISVLSLKEDSLQWPAFLQPCKKICARLWLFCIFKPYFPWVPTSLVVLLKIHSSLKKDLICHVINVQNDIMLLPCKVLKRVLIFSYPFPIKGKKRNGMMSCHRLADCFSPGASRESRVIYVGIFSL